MVEPKSDEAASGFLRTYRDWVRSAAVLREHVGAPPAPPIREKLLRCIWSEQYFETTALRTEDGRRLRLFSPGYFHEGAGPDFRQAEFAFEDGPRLRADVELHVASSGWKAHGHFNDAAYDRVGLHVVLQNDLHADYVFHNERAIPQLVLGFRLSADLKEIIASLDGRTADPAPAADGPCGRAGGAAPADADWVGTLLDAAGDERMLLKAARFRRALESAGPDTIFYAAFMDAMGYSANRSGFVRLAERVPLALLKARVSAGASPEERRRSVEALLFGASGFLDAALADPDPETRDYASALAAQRRGTDGDAAPAMELSAWVLGGTRPVNHPARRIAAAAAVIALHLHTGLARAVLDALTPPATAVNGSGRRRSLLKELAAVLDPPTGTYWARRTHFGPPNLPRPARLIGKTRMEAVALNLCIPLALAVTEDSERERAERRLHAIYTALPPGADNAVTRYVSRRLFGAFEKARAVVTTARRRQGLIQVFHDFCGAPNLTCDTCGFLAAMERHAT